MKGYGILETYQLNVNDLIVDVNVVLSKDDFVPLYLLSITNISPTTQIILDKLKEEFVSEHVTDLKKFSEGFKEKSIQEEFRERIRGMLSKYFPEINNRTMNMLVSFVIQQNLGMGDVEILLRDDNLEEIVVNNSKENIWVYHRRHGWLKTNIVLKTEDRIRHYCTMIGREVGKEITVLSPLMDAHLGGGDRVNATLSPISTKGNTITIRKFSAKPWTVTDMLKSNTINFEAAAFIWMAIQHEQSTIISGGTASGKTSMLNVVSNFFPPNQRIISVEDTREITLPNTFHWVPMETRLANPEGKGEVSMLDLIVNSLRMRPDRIIVGEIRRKREAEVLFEAMHTGHSVYGTIHANNAEETVTRLTNPPIDIPKQMISSLSMIITQNMNRRTGKRRTMQIAEVKPDGTPSVIFQFNPGKDTLERINDPVTMYEKIYLYSGLGKKEIEDNIKEKIEILKMIHKNNVVDIHRLGYLIANYYRGRPMTEMLGR